MDEGIVLAAGRNKIRVAMRGQNDTTELHFSHGEWTSDQDLKFDIEALTAGANCEMSQFENMLRARVMTVGMQLPG